MSLRVSHVGLVLALAVWPLAEPRPCQAQTRKRSTGRPIEFTEPNGYSTNRSPIDASPSPRFEEELPSPTKGMFPNSSSLSGIPAPTIRRSIGPAIQNKRVQELLERRKNWIFTSPKDLTAGSPAEEFFNLSEKPKQDADQDNDQKMSPEQYYRNLQKKQSSVADSDAQDSAQSISAEVFSKRKDPNRRTGKDNEEEEEDNGLSRKGPRATDLKEDGLNAKGLLDGDSNKRSLLTEGARGTFADIFALGNRDATSDAEVRAEKKRSERTLEEFRKLQPFSSAATSSTEPIRSLGSFTEPRGMRPNPLPVTDNLPTVTKPEVAADKSLEAQFGMLPPLPGVQDASLKAYAPPGGSATPFKIDLQPKVTPPVPTFTAPRRSF